jgi:hypothetical protein
MGLRIFICRESVGDFSKVTATDYNRSPVRSTRGQRNCQMNSWDRSQGGLLGLLARRSARLLLFERQLYRKARGEAVRGFPGLFIRVEPVALDRVNASMSDVAEIIRAVLKARG